MRPRMCEITAPAMDRGIVPRTLPSSMTDRLLSGAEALAEGPDFMPSSLRTCTNPGQCLHKYTSSTHLIRKPARAATQKPYPAHRGQGPFDPGSVPWLIGDDAGVGREMVEQSTGGTVRSVDRAEEAPRFGQQLAHRRCPQLSKVGATMDGSEVRQVPASRGMTSWVKGVQMLCEGSPPLNHS